MDDTDTLAVLELSLALNYDAEPKVHCAAQRRDQWGWVAVTCQLHAGHEGSHIDVHAGRRFTDKEVAS